MKKFLMIAALVAMVAAPAFAGVTPERNSNYPEFTATAVAEGSGAAARSAIYTMNSPDHVYDNYQSSAGTPSAPVAPDDVIYSWSNKNTTSGQNFLGQYNRLKLKPGATNITQMHLRIVTGREVGPTQLPLQVAFYSTAGTSGFAVGSFLADTAANTAFYAFNLTNPAAPALFNYTLTWTNPIVAPANGNLWIGFQSSMKFSIRGGLEQGTQVDGGPGDALPTAKYIGSGSGVFATGVGLLSASGITSSMAFKTAFTSSGVPTAYLNNFHLALGGVPEPTTAVLLALGGLVALRRRRA